jgi:hypothetical protein
VAVGDTLMLADVEPLSHRYVPPPLAVRFALAPVQMIPSLFVLPEVSVTAIEAVGREFTVTVAEPFMVVVQLLVVLVPTTVYTPAAV